MGTESYEFSGLSLTPTIFSKLLITLFDGKRFNRQATISEVVNYHRANGGIIKKGHNPINVFKKATLDLRKKDIGLVNKGQGLWELHYHEPELVEVVTDSSEVDEVMYSVDEILGTGSNALETAFHNIMKVKGRWMADAPGKEWFMTSPDEIKAIYTSVLM